MHAGKGEWKAPDGSNLPVIMSTANRSQQQRQQQRQGNGSANAEPPLMLIQDFDLYTQASRSPFLDLAVGSNVLMRDVGISLFCSAAGTPGKWPPPLPSNRHPSDGSDSESHGTDTKGRTVAPSPPLAFVTIRKVSGKFFGLPLDGIFGNADAMSLILVSGATHGRLDFYQASTEHSGHNPQTLLNDSTDVHFHSWKYESSLTGDKAKTSNSSLVWIQNSSTIALFGGAGYYRTYLGAPMIELRDGSRDITLMGLEREWAFK